MPEAKILTGLMERRALEVAFAALAGARTRAEQSEIADEIAGFGSVALSTLVAQLDTGDPQLRGGLGQVALRLDHAEVAAALRAAMRAAGSSEQVRLSAVTLLDRYLNEPIGDDLPGAPGDTARAADQSLLELRGEMARDPGVVLEYLQQLAQQPPEVGQAILEAVRRTPADPALVTLLRVLVQGEERGLAADALALLEQIRLPEAVAALGALAWMLPEPAASQSERGRRKLLMRGVPEPQPELAPDRWRCLISAVDGAGAQVLLFAHPDGAAGEGLLLTLLTAEPGGILACTATAARLEEAVPPAGAGWVHAMEAGRRGGALALLEAPFDLGRALARRSAGSNWSAGELLPEAYRCFGGPLWMGPAPVEPETPRPGAHIPDAELELLELTWFSDWLLRTPEIAAAARELASRGDEAGLAATVSTLARRLFPAAVTGAYRRRLERMALWLAAARQPEVAALAALAAQRLEGRDAADLPFIRRLIERSLDLAASRRPIRPGRHAEAERPAEHPVRGG